MDTLTFLRGLPLLSGLPEEQIQTLAAHARTRDYAAGQVILAEREAARGLYILMEGRAAISRSTPEGREQTIYVFGPGEPFCLCSMFADKRQPATATAMEPCRVLVIADRDFTAIAEAQPAVLFGMLLILSRRLKEAMDRIESLSVREIPVRLAGYLSHAAAGTQRHTLPMSHRQLAKVIGATPEALSRAFRKLADQGLARAEGRNIRILDPSGLADLAGREAQSGSQCGDV